MYRSDKVAKTFAYETNGTKFHREPHGLRKVINKKSKQDIQLPLRAQM